MLRSSGGRVVSGGLVIVLGLLVLGLGGCRGTPGALVDPCDPCGVACDPCAGSPPSGPCGIPQGVCPGEAWCRVWVPPSYGTVAEVVCVQPAMQEKRWVPARYGTRPKIVCYSPPTLNEKLTPAVWGKKTRERVVCPEREEWKRVCCPQGELNPCEVQGECWTKCVRPAVTCEEDCPVCVAPERRCVQYKPAEYKVVEERYCSQPGRWVNNCIPPKFERRCRDVCISPGHWEWRRNPTCEVPCAPCPPVCVPMPVPCAPPVPMPMPAPALQVEMQDSAESGAAEGIFAVGDTVRYDLKILSDEGSSPMTGLSVTFVLPPELSFISGGGSGVAITGGGQGANSAPFDLPIGSTVQLHVLCKVTGVPPTNLVQLHAAVMGADGMELATETESTTLKPGS